MAAGVSRSRLAETAAAVAADPPPGDPWAGVRGAMPNPRWVTPIRRAGWPVRQVSGVMLPQMESEYSRRPGQSTAPAPQTVTVVPVAWLESMARLLEVPWGRDVCRGIVEDIGDT